MVEHNEVAPLNPELSELLATYAGRAIMAVEAPVYHLSSHRQMGVRWLEPGLHEQQLTNTVTKPDWMHEGVEFLYCEVGRDADGNSVIVGEFYVEGGGLVAVKIEDIEAIKITKIFEQNLIDAASDRYDENIHRLMARSNG
jgi:hypothetical protein